MAAMQQAASLADHFLIAMPSLADPHFVRGVTLICQHDEFGAMGLVVNHRSEYNLDEVLRQMEITTDSAALFAKLAELARAEEAWNQARGLASTCEYRMPPGTAVQAGRCVAVPAGLP